MLDNMEVRLSLTILGFRESEIQEHSIWIREVQNSERKEVPCGTYVDDVSKFRISAYRRVRGRDFCPECPEVMKS
jgi:hypothetical protein